MIREFKKNQPATTEAQSENVPSPVEVTHDPSFMEKVNQAPAVASATPAANNEKSPAELLNGSPRQVLITLEELEKLIDKKVAERSINQTVIYQDPNDIRSLQNQSLYDPSDVLDKPAVFFAHNYGHCYISNTRSGKEDPNPIGNRAVVFKLWQSELGGTSSDPTIVHICRFATNSKKEAAWLRRHNSFGVDFYEYLEDVTKINMDMEAFRQEASARVKNIPDDQVIGMIKQNMASYPGMKVTTSISDMRRMLIPMIADQVKKEQELRTRNILEKSLETEKLLKTTIS